MSSRSPLAACLTLGLACLAAAAPLCAGDAPAAQPETALETLGRWLRQEDPILRALAAFELRRHADVGAVELATRSLGAETDPVVLGCALGSLAGRPRADLVAGGGSILPALLLRLAEHEHPLLRDRAYAALRRIAAEDPGRGIAAWRRWWLERRGALDEEQATLRAAAGAHPPEPPPPAAEGETVSVQGKRPDLYDYVARLRLEGLEVCIVIDSTGSMGPVIGAATSRSAALVARLQWLVPRFRAGLVTYDDGCRLREPLTADGEVLAKAFRKVSANGGGDWEEGVDKGISLALRQEALGWSRRAHRVIVVVGDAPPHEGDVAGLMARIAAAREDVLYDHPVVVHAVSTTAGGVEHFGEIARAGGGFHVTLDDLGRLAEELVALSFGADFQDRVRPWLQEVEHLRRLAPTR
jgi:Mg-chelatase subunit ChlD